MTAQRTLMGLILAPPVREVARRPLVRATVLPPSPADLAAVAHIIDRIRAADAPGPHCAAPCCPRRPAARGPWCTVHERAMRPNSIDDATAELERAGWKRLANGRWRSPVTGEVMLRGAAMLALRHQRGTP